MALLICAAALMAGCAEERPWNVLLITFDTTRADFIGAYGRPDATTPTLDGMAARGYLFERARTSNPITQPAHSTILSGVYPLMHGVRDNGLFRLPENLDTLAEMLKRHGYTTGAAVGGFPLTREFGTDQGFDFYDDDLRANKQDHRGRPAAARFNTWYDERPAQHVNDAILGWLRDLPEQPFFAWVHYWDPHHHHIAPAPFGQLYAHDPYQGEIAYADQALGTLLGQLEAMGELDRTLIVMTSDHGEGRDEHQEATHAFLAYETTLHVPLIMQVPGKAAGIRVGQNVGTVDIVPTVLDLLGFPIPQAVQGRSLVPLMADRVEPWVAQEEHYYAESMSPRLSHGFGDLRVIYSGDRKYIHGPRPELFDLEADPRELVDLAASDPDAVADLRKQLATLVEWHAGELSASHEFSEETMQQLAGLGYLNLSGESVSVDERLREDGEAPQDQVRSINGIFRLRRMMGSGAFRPAAALAEKLLQGNPNSGYLQAQLAMAHLGMCEMEQALAIVQRFQPPDPASIDAFAEVALGWAEAGAREEALELIGELLEHQVSTGALMAQAGIYALLEDWDRQAEVLEKAVAQKSTDRSARLALAFALLEANRPDAAEEQLDWLLQRAPGHQRVQFGLSRVLWQRQQFENALQRLDRAILLNPGNCEALETRIRWLHELGRGDDARAAARALPNHCESPS
jgi:arylsulfatase A-like enzyme/Flp pilus assembly protein TadD